MADYTKACPHDTTLHAASLIYIYIYVYISGVCFCCPTPPPSCSCARVSQEAKWKPSQAISSTGLCELSTTSNAIENRETTNHNDDNHHKFCMKTGKLQTALNLSFFLSLSLSVSLLSLPCTHRESNIVCSNLCSNVKPEQQKESSGT
jgi:hypothetical protein